jgi:hypothetical protein
MTALVEVLIGDWYGERERRAVAESVIFAERHRPVSIWRPEQPRSRRP